MPLFKRNFTAYFLNPTGYVFICVFVLLCSIAAFLPDEFISSNLANLAQLNRWFPLIMLVFIPAVTMGMWAEERRFGTEELLTTLPVAPLTIVCGKYLAAVGIYSVALLVSLISNYFILNFLGNPDTGLFLATGIGYWLIGLAMIAIGMTMSFMTSQLTIAYILGGLANIPLVALVWAEDLPVPAQLSRFLTACSLNHFFEPFGRGILSLSGFVYFLSIAGVMLWICTMILSSRYWPQSRRRARTGHTLFQTFALVLAAAALTGMTRAHDIRFDLTEEQLGSLSPESMTLVRDIKSEFPIVMEAWLSPEVPQHYVQTRLDIISVLNEISNRSGTKVFTEIHELQPNTDAAWRLERQYDIKPQKVIFDSRGRMREESIYLAVVFRCGPKTVVLPFINRGLSVEYELVSAFRNMGERERKTLGIFRTSAALLGRVDEQGHEVRRRWPIVDELRKDYHLVDLDPSQPIEENACDVLLVVQPSSLIASEMAVLADAIRRGIPTVIFEDPYPIFAEFIAGGTNIPPGMIRTSDGIRPKADLGVLFALLGISMDTGQVLWNNYNPYPKLAGLSEEFLFVDARPMVFDNKDKQDESSSKQPFDPNTPAVSHLEHLLFPFAGYLNADPRGESQVTPLIRSEALGTALVKDIVPSGIRSASRTRTDRKNLYTIAAKISGLVPEAFRSPKQTGLPPAMNVWFVADVDTLTPGFFRLREMGTDLRSGVIFDFDNVTFAMNLIDDAAGQPELIPIRSRRPRHRTLTRLEEATRAIRERTAGDQIAYTKEFENYRRREEDALARKAGELMQSQSGTTTTLSEEDSKELQTAIVAMRQRLTKTFEEQQMLYDRKVEQSQREVDRYVRHIQGRYKLYVVLLPPIFPLIIGLFVWRHRRKEQRKIMR
ncbi:MAG: Gldg family protein [Planctomycetia bacterium]|nr:Gldg family protein [Planctomycetia bacterium]